MAQIILNIFHWICLCCTIGMASYCAYKFYLNEDTSVVEFETFGGVKNNIYPTLSLCFRGNGMFDNKSIWQKHVTDEIKSSIKPTTKYYERFLLGDIWAKEFLNISYNEVTPDFKRILRNIRMFSANESGDVNIYEWLSRNQMTKSTPFYESHKSPTDKCFSMDINTTTVEKLTDHYLVKIKFAIANFFHGVFAEKNFGWLFFSIYLSYPNQIMRAYPIMQLEKIQLRANSSSFKIMVHSIEVIQRRNKYNLPCDEQWKDVDNQIKDELVAKIGCRHEFWTSRPDAPTCHLQHQFSDLTVPRLMTIGSSFLKGYPKPCREIQTIISTTEEKVLNEDQAKKWSISRPFIQFEITLKGVTYKVIKSVRSFDGESLVGNLGGYIGLFLGFAIWQAPDLIIQGLKQLKNIFNSFIKV